MNGSGAYLVRLRLIFSRVRLWQAGNPLFIEPYTPIWRSNKFFGTVDTDAMGSDQVNWTLEELVVPCLQPEQIYNFFCLLDDMARQFRTEIGHIIQYVVERADFHGIPHFRSFEGRMLRFSLVDDSMWQVNPFQVLPIGRLIPAAHEPLPFNHVIECEITVATWWRLLQDLPYPFERSSIFDCYSEFSTLGSEHDVSSRALPHSTESSEVAEAEFPWIDEEDEEWLQHVLRQIAMPPLEGSQ